jgi:indole-3-glycerol phosphate synthase
LPETQGSDPLPGILAEIVATKRAELAELSRSAPAVERAAEAAAPARPFRAALRGSGSISLIAECKRRSPGAGAIRPDLDAGKLCAAYERAGAVALSVLTDRTYFAGSNDDLGAARAVTSIPLLRKDFTLDRLQVVEARAAGADAVLLIVRILSDSELDNLSREATALGMAALVEVHDRIELERAVRAGANTIGINNRDLSTFETDLETTARLIEDVPEGTVVVSESGIRTGSDVARLGEAGVDAILVGESLLTAPDPAAAAASLVGIPTLGRARA